MPNGRKVKSTQVHRENSEDAGKYTAIAEKTYMPAERINTRLKNFKSQSFSRKAHKQGVCGEAETSEGKISVLLCVYKETGETTGRINKSS